jgi:hypothetical protein
VLVQLVLTNTHGRRLTEGTIHPRTTEFALIGYISSQEKAMKILVTFDIPRLRNLTARVSKRLQFSECIYLRSWSDKPLLAAREGSAKQPLTRLPHSGLHLSNSARKVGFALHRMKVGERGLTQDEHG